MNKQVIINDICYLLLNIFHLVNYEVILFQKRLSLSMIEIKFRFIMDIVFDYLIMCPHDMQIHYLFLH